MHEVVLLAGGKGTRLRPYTDRKPKPMLKIGGKPIIYYIVKYLIKHGYRDMAITLNVKDNITEPYLTNTFKDVKLTFYYEEKPLNTAGAVKAIGEKNLEDNFLVMVADNLTTINFNEFKEKHIKSNAIATIASTTYTNLVQYGVIESENDVVKNFVEKPAFELTINTGFYYLNKRALTYIEYGDDFAKDVFPRMLKKGEKIKVYKGKFLWIDIGTVKSYEFVKSVFDLIELYWVSEK